MRPPFTLGTCRRLYAVMRSSLLSFFARGFRCTRMMSPVLTASVTFFGSLPTAPLAKAGFAHLISAILSVPFVSALGVSFPSIASGFASSSAKPSLATVPLVSITKATRQSPISLGASKVARRVFQSSKLSHLVRGPL